MKYDFSTLQKVEEFAAKLRAPSQPRYERLPNLKWLRNTEAAVTLSRFESPWPMFVREFGGSLSGDNVKQLPKGWTQPKTTRQSAQCLLQRNMMGIVILAEPKHLVQDLKGLTFGKIWFGTFAFCQHKNVTVAKVGRYAHDYTCKSCKYSYTIDSSD